MESRSPHHCDYSLWLFTSNLLSITFQASVHFHQRDQNTLEVSALYNSVDQGRERKERVQHLQLLQETRKLEV